MNRQPLPGQLNTRGECRAGQIFEEHRAWVAQHEFEPSDCPRFGYLLMIDGPCLRSILGTTGPREADVSFPSSSRASWAGPYGYINILDVAEHDPEASDYVEGPFYDGRMRMGLDALVLFAGQTEDYPLCEQSIPLTSTDQVMYTGGTHARLEPRSLVTHRRREDSSYPCSILNSSPSTQA
ncbi:uncharacterized protein BO72DRAFT_494021 [Aspergillus fijiensis CBS 313.89]|uniref:Uncharacterized protein n=1 Tax=Aspergillus fijiensis CBS 313.89 TaxID=1448319 RepID=A0A8G1W0A0_9EURO|nr:uncharacterized protein BO72DRAFT_494021 [Aspergillus fijiensis CBS 313.89]RAK79665.1 hypothetical protein BO72DRAFT_494021 [Aspergillus fijiensis CBS 313.89]